MQCKNLTLIGTSHIAKQSVNDIKKNFTKINPDIVAIELDKKRLVALLNKRNKPKYGFLMIFKVGIKGYFFSLIGEWVEKKLGEQVGISPGTDMMTAFKLARKEKKQVALIDQDIEITLKKLSKSISWREKWNFLVDIFKAVILRKKEIEGFDLNTVPDKKIMDKLLKKTKLRYPNLYRVLVTERNNIMAKNLAVIMTKNPDKSILGIIGAGHEEAMMKIIKNKLNKIEVIDPSYSYTVNYP